MDRNALAELLQALESRRDAEERRREERYTALIERNRQCRKEELEQPGRTAASGTRATSVEYQSGDKPANEKGCEEESQRTRTLKWSAAIKEEKERHS
ncbi:UNVERIFIED_CONTAM: hypothetical protein FKN15_039466 [Acipenser sinensis]